LYENFETTAAQCGQLPLRYWVSLAFYSYCDTPPTPDFYRFGPV
jgi:hypothetical protein